MNDKFTECERNLSLTSSIQGFGAIIRFNKNTDLITHVSANVCQQLKMEIQLGQAVAEVFPNYFCQQLKQLKSGVTTLNTLKDLNTRCFFEPASDGCILEFEPHEVSDTNPPIFNIDRKSKQKDALDLTLQYLSKLSGFERSLYYQFLPDGTGVVMGEEYHGDADRYLNLRYPATDIPKVARSLYLKNEYRYIYDIHEKPVNIQSLPGNKHLQLDLTYAITRSVSHFHITYLKNMKVGCSFSLPVIQANQLIGLFTLHNKTPIYLPHRVRKMMCEAVKKYNLYIAQTSIENRIRFMDKYSREIESFCWMMLNKQEYDKVLIDQILAATGSQAILLKTGDDWTYFGLTELHPAFDRLVNALWASDYKGTLVTDCLESAFPSLSDLTPIAAGTLCAWFEHHYQTVTIIFIKPEITQEVVWGSQVDFYSRSEHPVNSFGQWRKNMQHHSEPWSNDAKIAIQSILNIGKKIHLPINA